MQVQINSPHESLPDAFVELIQSSVKEGLSAHAKRLTRVEIHFQDQNAQKGGIDKRCVIEARPSGLHPVAADHEDKSLNEAFRGALEKLRHVLQHRIGRLESH